MASLAKLAQREESRKVNVLDRGDGTCTNPGKETIELLTKTHFPAATSNRKVLYYNWRNALTKTISDKYKKWITPSLIRDPLVGFEKKESPGPDNIKPLVF